MTVWEVMTTLSVSSTKPSAGWITRVKEEAKLTERPGPQQNVYDCK
jgi:hypothetical protein